MIASITFRVNYVHSSIHVNTIKGTWSQFKRRIVGIYHDISEKHLQRCLNKFAGRADIREVKEHERVNEILAKSQGKRLRYAEMTA